MSETAHAEAIVSRAALKLVVLLSARAGEIAFELL